MKIKATNIEWETDGEDVPDLPSEMIVEVSPENENDNDEIEELISDQLSNENGWLHNGFRWERSKTYQVPVFYQMFALMNIEAFSKEDAEEKAFDAPLPDYSEYVDGSFEIDEEMWRDSLENME